MRKLFLTMAAAAMCLAAGPGANPAAAQASWPSKPVKIVVPYAAGGGTDLIARAIAKSLSDQYGQRFFVENVPGSVTIRGTETIARADADGHAFLITSVDFVIAPVMEKDLPYDPLKDFDPITIFGEVPLLLSARGTLEANTLQELVAAAKAKPGSISTAWSGQSTYLAFELLRLKTGADIVHIAYKGTGQVIPDILGGHVDTALTSPGPLVPHIKEGKVKALAVTTAKRSPLLPDVPTIGETVPGYAVPVWFGAAAPAGTPKEIREKIAAGIQKAAASPDVSQIFDKIGAAAVTTSVDDTGKQIRDDIEKWTELLKTPGMKMP